MADPEFPRGGGANSPGGRQHTISPNFPKNRMKLKEFRSPGGARVPRAPLRSATGSECYQEMPIFPIWPCYENQL